MEVLLTQMKVKKIIDIGLKCKSQPFLKVLFTHRLLFFCTIFEFSSQCDISMMINLYLSTTSLIFEKLNLQTFLLTTNSFIRSWILWMEYDYLEKQQQTILYRRTQLVQRIRCIFPCNDWSHGRHKYERRFKKPFTRYFHRNFSGSGYGVSLFKCRNSYFLH